METPKSSTLGFETAPQQPASAAGTQLPRAARRAAGAKGARRLSRVRKMKGLLPRGLASACAGPSSRSPMASGAAARCHGPASLRDEAGEALPLEDWVLPGKQVSAGEAA